MKLLRGLDDSSAGPGSYRDGFVAIGNFDGVHRGHQSMITTLVERAHAAHVPSVALTFDPHPIVLLRPDQAPPSLSTLARKSELLGQCGVDFVITYPTDWKLLQLTPSEFFEQIIQQKLAARGLVEGPNFFFGHNREGDIATLQSLCDSAGLRLDVIPPIKVGDRLISSSVIRSLIAVGDMAQAVELLGHPYRVCGVVTQGAGRGQTIGFPTANLERIETLLPADGVYAAIAHYSDDSYPAAINVGPSPTFDDNAHKLEAHLIGFSGDLYNQSLNIDFLERIRDTVSFENADALKHQLQNDVETVAGVVKGRLR